MSKDDTNNPLEELQKQLQGLLGKTNVNFGFTPIGTESADEEAVDPEGTIQLAEGEALKAIKKFNFKPKEIRDYLDRFVVKQDEAKKVLSVAVCDHYNHIRQCIENKDLKNQEYSKQNILLLGPTGVGKTYLMRTIAKLIGVPFVKADATKFSETGYVGGDVDDLVRDLVKAANGDTELAQYGIIYIDEIDKVANDSGRGGGKDVSGRGVQINLLKLMEDTDVNLLSPADMMSQMQAMMEMTRGKDKKRQRTMNTRHILFIVSGAFGKLAEDIQKRLGSASIGFNSANTQMSDDIYSYLKEAESSDFIKYGFEPEFVGRLPVRVACSSLEADDLANVLTSSEGSILKQYKNDFKGYGITLDIDGESILEIAAQAYKEKTGARGLLTVLEKLFREFKFELPSTAIKKLSVTTHTVRDPGATLAELKKENKHLQQGVLLEDIRRFSDDFHMEHSLRLNFDDEAIDFLVQKSETKGKTIRSICEAKFKDFQHGLKIIARNTGQKEFSINKKTVMNPDKELSKWVVDGFKSSEKKAAQENAEEPMIITES